MLSPLAMPFLAAVAVLSALGVLSFMALTLMHSEAPDGWPLTKAPKLSGKHELATAPADATRPRDWDTVTADRPVLAEAYVKIPLPEVDDEPVDELDPRWDWRAFADALDAEAETRELTSA